jgi:hemerythrin-like domain-containing protein
VSGPESAPANSLFDELLWVHSMVRRDLGIVTTLAEEVATGLEPAELREQIQSLKDNGPLWQLKVNCLHYCRFVHSHHDLEDAALFPALRRTNPDLGPVVDKLEADHRQVSALLDTVEAAAAELEAGDDQVHRALLVEALEALGGVLLEHLEFEERSIESTLARMTSLRG